MKLRTYLSLAFGLLAIVITGSLSLAANQLLIHQFHRYVSAWQEQNNLALVDSLERGYSIYRSEWTSSWLEERCVTALENGQILTIAALDGTVLWNAHEHDNDRCMELITSMQRNVTALYPSESGQYVEKEYPLVFMNEPIATVHIGSYEPYHLTQSDVDFLNSLNRIFIIATIGSMLIALLAAYFLAMRLSKPVTRATQAANKIAGGHYENLMDENSAIFEMSDLASAVNHLSDSLIEQEQLRTRLTRDIAHELRTPITTLQAQIEAMQDGIWEPDSKRLASLQEEILRLGRLIEDLTNLARYENDVLPLHPEKTDLAALVEEIAERYQAQFRSQSLLLKLELERVWADIDPDRFRQVMVNLLDNALKNTAEGSITIGTKQIDRAAIITVADTGIGIPQAHIQHIFDRFYRADDSRRRDTGGAGIGLSIVKSIVAAHGGSIRVDSEPDKGSTFMIQLPLSER